MQFDSTVHLEKHNDNRSNQIQSFRFARCYVKKIDRNHKLMAIKENVMF